MRQSRFAFQGVLEQPPFPDKAVAADIMTFPLQTPDDFENYTGFDLSIKSPVLLSFQEHYQFLEQLLLKVDELALPLDMTFVRLSMPCIGRLPARLLKDDVFLSIHNELEVQALLDEGLNLLVVDDWFKKHHLDCGDNRIALDLYTNGNLDDEALPQLHEFLTAHGIVSKAE
ncbi:hypothetical protein QQM79_18695 [Marinobacteraceae bacterium S3BR75-40.1]